MPVGHFSHRRNINDIACGVTNGLHEHGLGVVVDQGFQGSNGIVRSETHIDPQRRKHMRKQRVGAAVKLRHGYDVVSGLGNVDDRVVNGSAAGRDSQSANSAL